jgi:hypothetical protein
MISIVNTECHVPKTFSDLAKIAAWGRLGLDAAMKDPAWESRLNDLMGRISRDQDRKAFDGWTFKGGPADA